MVLYGSVRYCIVGFSWRQRCLRYITSGRHLSKDTNQCKWRQQNMIVVAVKQDSVTLSLSIYNDIMTHCPYKYATTPRTRHLHYRQHARTVTITHKYVFISNKFSFKWYQCDDLTNSDAAHLAFFAESQIASCVGAAHASHAPGDTPSVPVHRFRQRSLITARLSARARQRRWRNLAVHLWSVNGQKASVRGRGSGVPTRANSRSERHTPLMADGGVCGLPDHLPTDRQ